MTCHVVGTTFQCVEEIHLENARLPTALHNVSSNPFVFNPHAHRTLPSPP
jgi:hypothetical protein